jgi:hypothetical protein
MRDKDWKIVVKRLNGLKVLEGQGSLDGYQNKPAVHFGVRFEGSEYPSDQLLWLEASKGNIVVQGKVKVEYVGGQYSPEPYTKFQSVDGSVKTFDKRYDFNIPCSPQCEAGHNRR